jgi:hypothetical protein
MRKTIRRLGTPLFAATAIVAVSSVPWLCAWAELSAPVSILVIGFTELLWLLIWTRRCMAVWRAGTDEAWRKFPEQINSRRYPSGVDAVYS